MVAPYAGTPRPPQPDETGTAVYIPVTNAVESLNSRLRKAVRLRGHFPSDEAATKLLFLDKEAQTLTVHIRAEGMEPGQVHAQHIHGFADDTDAKTQFAVRFGDRFVVG